MERETIRALGGLPPTPERIAQILRNAASDVRAVVVDFGAAPHGMSRWVAIQTVSHAVRAMDALKKADARYDLGFWRDQILELLVVLGAGEGARAFQLNAAAEQFVAMADSVLVLEGRKPKPLDLTADAEARR